MKWIKTLFIAALFWVPATASHASCAIDGVAAKTDTTISISWDVSGCNHLSAYATFRVCWKNAANSGNACIPPTIDSYGETGTSTITGLSPSTAYRIRTLWHKGSNWWDVTTRVVTTNPSSASSGTTLRYEKGWSQGYCVNFFWKNPPTPSPSWKLTMDFKNRFLGMWVSLPDIDLTNATYNSSTSEYRMDQCGLSVGKYYRAFIYQKSISNGSNLGTVSNTIEWH